MSKYLSFFNLFKTPMAPLILGLGGTLPFIFLSVVIWMGSTDLQLIALFNLINYSIIILSFVVGLPNLIASNMVPENINVF